MGCLKMIVLRQFFLHVQIYMPAGLHRDAKTFKHITRIWYDLLQMRKRYPCMARHDTVLSGVSSRMPILAEMQEKAENSAASAFVFPGRYRTGIRFL